MILHIWEQECEIRVFFFVEEKTERIESATSYSLNL